MCSHTSSHSARQVVSGCLQVIGTRSVDRSGFGPQGPGEGRPVGVQQSRDRAEAQLARDGVEEYRVVVCVLGEGLGL